MFCFDSFLRQRRRIPTRLALGAQVLVIFRLQDLTACILSSTDVLCFCFFTLLHS